MPSSAYTYTLSLHDALPIFELGVDFLLGSSRCDFLIVEPRQAVLAERIAHLERALAQSHIVAFRSGEILHGCAKRLRRQEAQDRKSTRLNSSHLGISYAVFCLHLHPFPTRRSSDL